MNIQFGIKTCLEARITNETTMCTFVFNRPRGQVRLNIAFPLIERDTYDGAQTPHFQSGDQSESNNDC